MSIKKISDLQPILPNQVKPGDFFYVVKSGDPLSESRIITKQNLREALKIDDYESINVELRRTADFIQWRYLGDIETP